MGKLIECPVKRFAGSVELKDPLPYLVVVSFEAAARDARGTGDDMGKCFLPVLIEAVEKWNLENIPEGVKLETFPGSPRKAVLELIAWLMNEVTAIYKGNEDNDPNE